MEKKVADRVSRVLSMKTMISASLVGVIVPFRTELRKEHGRIGFEGDASGRFWGKQIVQVTTQNLERSVFKRPPQEPGSDPLSSTRGKKIIRCQYY